MVNIIQGFFPNQVCVTKLETETLQQSISMEIFFAIGFALVGYLVNSVGKFPVLCKKFIYKFIHLYFKAIGIFDSIVVVFSGCGACGIICMLTNIPIIQICCFMVLMMSGLATNVVNAATVELYPTSVRYNWLHFFGSILKKL